MQNAVYLLSNAVHMYAVYVLFSAVFGKSRFCKWAEILTYAIYYAVNCGVYLFMDNPLLNLLSNIVPMFLIMFQYRKPLQTYVFMTLGICAVGMFLDWMFTCINPDFILIKTNTPQSIAFLGCVFLFRHYFNRKEKIIVNSGYVVFLIVISVGTIVIAESLGPEFDRESLITSLILLMINFLNFFLYDKYIENMQMRIMYNAVESSNRAYQNQLGIMNESQKRIRLIKHDMKNHILRLKHHIDNGDIIAANEYIDEMTDNMSSENEIVSTGNVDFDCLLNYKLSKAKEIGVQFTCNVILPEELNVSSFDLTVIIGNLLDNALNALEETDVKSLNVDVKYSIGMIVITIENTFSKKHKQYDNPSEHGYGLISVQTSLDKYNGKLETSSTEDRFTARAVLYN